MNDTRKQQIRDIVDIYTNRYTCACMADRLADEERECLEANRWMLAQMTANGISKQELKEAINELEVIANQQGQAFGYDLDLLR